MSGLKEMTKNVKDDLLNMEERVPSPSDAESCVSSAGGRGGGDSVKGSEVDVNVNEHESTPQSLPLYPSTPYYSGYYYLGCDGSTGGLDGQGHYIVTDGNGVQHQYPVMQGDDGSLMYLMPGFQPAYDPYSPYVLPSVGVDGQYVGQQPLSPISLFQPFITSPEYFTTTLPYGEMAVSPYLWDPSIFVGDGTYANGYSGVMEIPSSKANKSSASHTGAPLSKGSVPSLDVSSGHGTRKQSKVVTKASQNGSTFQTDVFGKGFLPHAKFPLYNQGKVGPLYSIYPVNVKAKARGWGVSEKLKSDKTNNIDNFGLPNEQNHGPRTTYGKASLMSGGTAAGSLATDGNSNCNNITSVMRRDHYNLPDFPTSYNHAFFFVIKSYSEDDIHRSIKYNVWASTANGNKRLDSAYQDAQEKTAEQGSKCPVLLFFSVNASGQFCGVAEMIGRVDFSKSMDFWQQDKWNGYFPVKWHIIKDVPNPQLRHIILENNDNKPVTNSRDTQEVRFPQGIEMLNILKNYVSKTSILDDFDFYESRQKVMQEKRIRSSKLHVDPQQQRAGELAASLQSVDLSAAKNIEELLVTD